MDSYMYVPCATLMALKTCDWELLIPSSLVMGPFVVLRKYACGVGSGGQRGRGSRRKRAGPWRRGPGW